MSVRCLKRTISYKSCFAIFVITLRIFFLHYFCIGGNYRFTVMDTQAFTVIHRNFCKMFLCRDFLNGFPPGINLKIKKGDFYPSQLLKDQSTGTETNFMFSWKYCQHICKTKSIIPVVWMQS